MFIYVSHQLYKLLYLRYLLKTYCCIELKRTIGKYWQLSILAFYPSITIVLIYTMTADGKAFTLVLSLVNGTVVGTLHSAENS